jgi:hypothetical protein
MRDHSTAPFPHFVGLHSTINQQPPIAHCALCTALQQSQLFSSCAEIFPKRGGRKGQRRGHGGSTKKWRPLRPSAGTSALRQSQLFASCDEISRSAAVPAAQATHGWTLGIAPTTPQAPDVAAPGDGRTPIRCGSAALRPLRLRRDSALVLGCGFAALNSFAAILPLTRNRNEDLSQHVPG